MARKLSLSLFLIFINLFGLLIPAFSQSNATIKGLVIGADANPIEYATVALLTAQDSVVKSGATTNANGLYILEGISAGQYVLRVQYLGYSRYLSQPFAVVSGQQLELPAIQLLHGSNMLKEVEVSAQRALIEMLGGKLLYHVEGNDALKGITAKEVLNTAPGVTHDRRGYQLNGRPGAKVLIDGRDRSLTLEGVLSSLRAEDILRIELLSNPSAHYDAQGVGGVINIVTKRNTNEGLSGIYGLNTSAGREQLRYSSNLGLNYKKGIVTLFSDLRINRFANQTNSETHQSFQESSVVWQKQKVEANLTSLVPSASLGGEFNLSQRSQLGFELWGMDGNSRSLNTTFRVANAYDGEEVVNIQDSKVQTDSRTLWANLHFKQQLDSTGQQLRFDANYQRSNNLMNGLYHNTHINRSGKPAKAPFTLHNTLPALSDLLTVQVDYELPFNENGKIDLGAKYSYNSTENDVRYALEQGGEHIIEDFFSKHYRYKEALLAFYGSYQLMLNGWSLVMGLRAENTDYGLDFISDRYRETGNYWSLFPNVSVSRQVGEAHQFSYSASRRIQRQPYEYMNPFVQYIDEVNFVQGNPDLRPSYSYNFDMQHSYNYQYFTSLGYSYTNDVAVMSYELVPGLNNTRISIGNLASMHTISFSFSAPYQVASWWKTNNSVNGFLNKYESDSELVAYNEGFNLNYNLRNVHSFQLPRKWKSSVTFSYFGPSVGGMNYDYGWFTSNIGLSKKILKEKGSINFSAQDIFRTSRTKMRYRYDGTDATSISYSDTQRIGVSFNYNFGNSKVKRVQYNRTNYEEQSRMNSRTN